MGAWLRHNAAVLAVGIAAIGLILNQLSEFKELSGKVDALGFRMDRLEAIVAANGRAIAGNRAAIADVQARLPTLASTEKPKPQP